MTTNEMRSLATTAESEIRAAMLVIASRKRADMGPCCAAIASWIAAHCSLRAMYLLLPAIAMMSGSEETRAMLGNLRIASRNARWNPQYGVTAQANRLLMASWMAERMSRAAD